jgi:hypothetical protein
MSLHDSVEYLLNRRAALTPHHYGSHDWAANDPVVGFLAPILWYLNGQRTKTSSQQFEPGEKEFWVNVGRFTSMRYWLGKVIAGFRDAGIPVIVLKGALLAKTLYPSPGLRYMSDLDLLVRFHDFRDALNLLKQMGWVPNRIRGKEQLLETIGGTDTEESWQMGEWTFLNPKGCFIDLHWHLIPYVWLRHVFRINMDAVWQDAVLLTDQNLQGASGLSSVQTLSYLCLLLAQEGLNHLRGLLDIDQFVRKSTAFQNWSWDGFTYYTRKWRIRSAAFHALYFSRSLFNTPVPETVLDALDPGLAARARVAVFIRPQDLLIYPSSAPGTRYTGLVKLALADHITDLVGLLAKFVIPDIRYRKQRYGANTGLYHHWRHVWKVFRRGT